MGLRKAVRREVELQAQRLAVPMVRLPDPVAEQAPQDEAVPTIPMPLDTPASATALKLHPASQKFPWFRTEPAAQSLLSSGLRVCAAGCWAATPSYAWACWCCSSALRSWLGTPPTMPAAARTAPGRAVVGLVGCALLVAGWRLRLAQERALYAPDLQGAGVAVLYLYRVCQFPPLSLPLTAGTAFCLDGCGARCPPPSPCCKTRRPWPLWGAGAFAAPLLVLHWAGDHVGLFSYYLLLGAYIAAVAWMRAWRAH